jgi:hypothetical protein
MERVVKELMQQEGFNTKSFAEKIGLPYTTLRSMLERGFAKSAVENVIKVCRGLGITVEQLETSAAHHDGEEWTEEELAEIEEFKKFVKMRKQLRQQQE